MSLKAGEFPASRERAWLRFASLWVVAMTILNY
jgi:hypothetical protein